MISTENHSSLSLCLSPGEAPRGAAGDGERECFWGRTGDRDAEWLLERETDLHQQKKVLKDNETLSTKKKIELGGKSRRSIHA